MPPVSSIIVQLLHIQGPLKGRIQEFSRFPVHIGRHSACQIRFGKEMTTISRQHARIERQGNRFRIIDVSTNGTYVNGKRIADVYLRDGDVITFAENGPKASFLTKIGAGTTPMPRGPSDRSKPTRPGDSSTPPQAAAAASPFPVSEPGLTAGPDLEIPVISTGAPLVIQLGSDIQSYSLLPVTIGTDPACEFVIAGDTLSGRHVQIYFYDNQYYVKDLSGKRMVTINGRPAGTQAVLAQGAELALTDKGPRLKFFGDGRLAEIKDDGSELLEKTAKADNHQVPVNVPSTPLKKSASLIKNLFKKGK